MPLGDRTEGIIAQRLEQRTHNPSVAGSIPADPNYFLTGGFGAGAPFGFDGADMQHSLVSLKTR